MKKTIAGLLLTGVLVRLAVLAGAGEAMAVWVREHGGDERLVSAALQLELGAASGAELLRSLARAASGSAAEEAAAAAGSGTAGGANPAAAGGGDPAGEAPEATGAGPRLVTVERKVREEARSQGETAAAAQEPAPEPEIRTMRVLSEASSVHNRTRQEVDYEALAAEGLSLRLPADTPQVLIIHTHSSEAYTQDPGNPYEESDPYRTEDPAFSVIRVGDVLAEKLEESGLTVLHDREIYDYPSYTGSYSRSGAAVERCLADNPGIRVVIDLHRDAIGSGDVVYKTQATLDGRTSAQTMLLVGTGENGLWHPLWRENLKLALYLQHAVEERWPTLARPIELVSERYNQQLSTGMLILEVGSTGNTLREATLAAALFGEAAGPALAALIE